MATGGNHFDICVVGAGMVGAASACAFAKNGYKVAVIEPYMPEPFETQQAPDLRVSALNKHSLDLLSDLHALENIEKMRFRRYDSLQVWENELARTSFSAQDIGESQLGIFAENRIIQLALLQSIEDNFAGNITMFNAKAERIQTQSAELALESNELIQAKLIVGADGANSQVREAANIGQTGWDYAQRANLILINMHNKIADTTWQQFTPNGPLALLPMHDNYACLVWYASSEQSESIQSMSFEELKVAIVDTFPSQLEEFDVVEKAGFPLTRMHANHYWKDKAVLVGDAAHTINPLAGQGVNLGFKDVAALSESLKKASIDDLRHALTTYEHKRRAQNLLMMSSMDALYATFSNDIGPLKLLRNLALGAAERAGPLKNMALKYAMGI
jgi:2-octaprenyl-3-methyl-6-methoxy-1,4-benzoquinol hydroxylase